MYKGNSRTFKDEDLLPRFILSRRDRFEKQNITAIKAKPIGNRLRVKILPRLLIVIRHALLNCQVPEEEVRRRWNGGNTRCLISTVLKNQ